MARDRFHPDELTTLPVPLISTEFWDICRGVAFQIEPDLRGIDFIQIPSDLRGLSFRQWSIDVDDPYLLDIDPSQDLLIYIRVDRENKRLRVSGFISNFHADDHS